MLPRNMTHAIDQAPKQRLKVNTMWGLEKHCSVTAQCRDSRHLGLVGTMNLGAKIYPRAEHLISSCPRILGPFLTAWRARAIERTHQILPRPGSVQ
jgi:hypothetical protein